MSATYYPMIVADEAKKHYTITGGNIVFTLDFLSSSHADRWYWNKRDSGVVEISSSLNYPTLRGSFDFTNVRQSLSSSPVSVTFPNAASSTAVDKASGTLEFTYGLKADFVPRMTTNGFVNPSQTTPVSFAVDTQKTTSQYTVESAVMYYKQTGQSTYRSVQLNNLSIPAGTLAWGKTYEVYCACTADDGTTANTPTATLTTSDVVGSVRTVAPSGTVENANIRFIWNYDNNLGAPQYAYDLDYSTDGSVWTPIKQHALGDVTAADYYLNAAGRIYWRVRSYNQNDIASEYATADFINNVPPDSPVITGITSETAPVITWSSNGQIAFEIEIGGVIKETIYTGNKEYKVPAYLLNNDYTARLRTINALGTYSEPTTFTIQPTHLGETPDVTAEQVEGGVLVTVLNSFNRCYLLRDGVPVANFVGQYLDVKANAGENAYTIIGVVGNLASSVDVNVYYNCAVSVLISRDNAIIKINERFDNRPDVSYSKQQNGKLVQYLGRERPVWIDNGNYSRSWSVTCKNKDIYNYVGQVMKYRSSFGDNANVIVRSANAAHRYYGSDISVTLEEVDFSEVVEYAL